MREAAGKRQHAAAKSLAYYTNDTWYVTTIQHGAADVVRCTTSYIPGTEAGSTWYPWVRVVS